MPSTNLFANRFALFNSLSVLGNTAAITSIPKDGEKEREWEGEKKTEKDVRVFLLLILFLSYANSMGNRLGVAYNHAYDLCILLATSSANNSIQTHSNEWDGYTTMLYVRTRSCVFVCVCVNFVLGENLSCVKVKGLLGQMRNTFIFIQ